MNASAPREPKRVALLCPCYNEQGVVTLFLERLLPVVRELAGRYLVDIVFLNNASTDGTLAEILSLRSRWPNIFVITLSRNVGYQRSLECGLRNAKGDLFLFIDVDCEDPPELILEFVRHHEDGHDIVYGERVDREEPRYLVAARKFFYRLLRSFADEEIILDMAEFALFTAEVRDAIVQDASSFPFIRASISRVGFKRRAVPFKRERRIGGVTHYNFLGMTVFAIAGILASSTLLLRLPIYVLPFWLIATGWAVVAYAAEGSRWGLGTAFFLSAAYLGSTVAFISLYVARNYKNTLNRPNAFIDLKNCMLQSDREAASPAQRDLQGLT